MAHCSATSASNCSASAAETSVPRSAATSPRNSLTIVLCRGLAGGSRTRKASSNGSSGKRLPQFVSGAPEHLAAAAGLGKSRAHQRGLADAGLALDQNCPASPVSRFRHEPDKGCDLSVAADQHIGPGDGGHGANCTTGTFW